jgi:hypothetical protein
MLRILLSMSSVLAGCTASPQKAAMPSPSPVLGTADSGSSKSNPLGDSPAEAQGRRILSTAFVRVGPDGHLTVELHSGQALVLRDVTMGPKKYCGLQVAGGPARTRYCGGYAEVAAARPGGAPAPDHRDLAVPARTEPAPGPPKGR